MAYVSVHYGPYEACGVVRHRTQRLRGLKERLEIAGHTVELIPSPHWDRCVIEIGRRNIFRCRLTNFDYNTDGKGDIVCDRAMEAVNDAIARMKPHFLYPDIELFSTEFFDQAIDEAFRRLNVREYIDECLESAYTRMAVLECINVAIDEAMTGEYIRILIGDVLETTLHKDYMRDLIEAKLQDVFDLHDYMANAIYGAIEIRDFMKESIMEAITRTHPKIKEFIKNFVETAFNKACSELNLKGGSLGDIFKSTCDDSMATAEHISMKQILNELVDELSLRSRDSYTSLEPAESPYSSKRSDNSMTSYETGRHYNDKSNESLGYDDKSGSFTQN